MLCVRKSTNIVALYGELGRLPLSVIRKLNIIKYWIKILNQNNMSIVKNVYLMLKEDTETNCNYNGKIWAFQIRDMLRRLGLGFVWEQQFHIEIPFTLIKQRQIDNYLQKWYAEINNSSRLQSYCIFKHSFETESYLNTLAEKEYRVALSRFRISAHNLEIETGRYDNLPREQRL